MLSGALLSLTNPPLDLGPLAFVALIPLLHVLRTATPRRGALAAFVFGLVYYAILLRWLAVFGWIAWIPLVISQAGYAAVFGAVAPLLRRPARPWRWALGIAGLWTGVDWIRAVWPVGGFTWGGLGYTQHANGFLLPLATVKGVWGVTFVVVLVNALLLEALARGGRRAAAVPVVLAAGVVLAPAVIPIPGASGPRLDIAIVQGNVPRGAASDRLLQTAEVGQSHIALNRLLASDPPDLAVWPENALASDPSTDPALGRAVASSIRAVGSRTIVGGLAEAPGGNVYNEAFLYNGDGRIEARYAKTHLVPFGEYVPFQRILGWTNRYRLGNAILSPGRSIRTFSLGGVQVGTPICFENIFPDLFRRFVARGASLMVVTTNDSSFLDSPASRQHVIMSQLRAVETGRWVVHASISGVSAFVDPHGRVVAHTASFTRTILRHAVPASSSRTVYVRWGDWFPWACLATVALALGLALVRRRGRGPAQHPAPPAGEGGAGRAGRRRETPLPISGGADPRVLVVLPTYNERGTIARVLAGVVAVGPSVEALVVDDSSPDGTAEEVLAMAREGGRIRLISRPAKMGLASAYLTGFRTALQDGYDVVVEMDADLSHRPEDLSRVLEGSSRYDVTIGSRYAPGGAVSNWSRARLALSRAGNAYTRAALGLPVRDATSGFRAYRRPALESLVAEDIHSEGYAFQIELAYRAWRKGFSVGEVPITFRERMHGRSKLSRRIVVEALLKVAQWGFRDRLRRR